MVTDVICLHLCKAFDMVSHHILTFKLERDELTGLTVQGLKNWLDDGNQRVVVNGSKSRWKPVLSSDPQGSVLGPMHIFINNYRIECILSKFANDIMLHDAVNHPEEFGRLEN